MACSLLHGVRVPPLACPVSPFRLVPLHHHHGDCIALWWPCCLCVQVYHNGKKALDYNVDFFFFDTAHVSDHLTLPALAVGGPSHWVSHCCSSSTSTIRCGY